MNTVLIMVFRLKKMKEVSHINGIGDRTYYPDFYLPQDDLFIEVKGYETERDRAKWRDFPLKLKVIRKSDIEKFRAVSELNNRLVPGSNPGRPTNHSCRSSW